MVGELLQALRGLRLTWEDDSVSWKGGESGQFKVNEAYSWLDRPMEVNFPKNKIWVGRVPTKIMFVAWEATWGKILTLYRLQKRGWQFPNGVFCVLAKWKVWIIYLFIVQWLECFGT